MMQIHWKKHKLWNLIKCRWWQQMQQLGQENLRNQLTRSSTTRAELNKWHLRWSTGMNRCRYDCLEDHFLRVGACLRQHRFSHWLIVINAKTNLRICYLAKHCSITDQTGRKRSLRFYQGGIWINPSVFSGGELIRWRLHSVYYFIHLRRHKIRLREGICASRQLQHQRFFHICFNQTITECWTFGI